MCFSIGFHALIKQEIMVTPKKKWKGKSTLLLAIPLIALGVFMSWLVLTQMGYMYPSKSKNKNRTYQKNETMIKFDKILKDLEEQAPKEEKKETP